MVGRLPAHNAATLSMMINTKIKNDTTATDSVKKEILVATKDWSNTWTDRGDGQRTFDVYRENKKLIHARLPLLGFYERKLFGFDGATNAQLKGTIESGSGYLNYRGHGSVTSWSQWDAAGTSWTQTDIANLNVTDMEPIVWSLCCYNSAIDNLTGDCMGETWMKTGKATAHFGSSRQSPTTANNYFDSYIHNAMWVAMRQTATTDLGHILSWAKVKLSYLSDPNKTNSRWYATLAIME